MTQAYQFGFGEGQWVQLKENQLIGFIEESGMVWSVVYVPAARAESKRFNIQNHKMHKVGSRTCADDILAMMDITLLLGDKNWFNELSTQMRSSGGKSAG